MAKIIIKKINGTKPRYSIKYESKKYKNNSEVKLEEDSSIFLIKRSLFANKFFIIFCWFFIVLFWIGFFIASFFIDNAFFHYKEGGPKLRRIRINYSKIFKDEIVIGIGSHYIEASGIEIKSVIFDGEELKDLNGLGDGASDNVTANG